VFVLACGAIENARLLLASRSYRSAGLGNDRGLVGRFFMEHPQVDVGRFLPTVPGFRSSLYVEQGWPDVGVVGGLTFPEEQLRRYQISNFFALLRPGPLQHFEAARSSRGWKSLETIVQGARKAEVRDDVASHLWNVIRDLDRIAGASYERLAGTKLYEYARTYTVACTVEQVPTMESRVTLGNEPDAVGIPKARLDWRLSEQDLKTIRVGTELMAREVGRAGVGRFQHYSDWEQNIIGKFHHMGTTRMARDPNHGVVDSNCRVHSFENLYVAGSSVFPTVGYANPTLTLLALALRLGDHIPKVLQ
jgi:choline dehydrogenase-like flavoprotein